MTREVLSLTSGVPQVRPRESISTYIESDAFGPTVVAAKVGVDVAGSFRCLDIRELVTARFSCRPVGRVPTAVVIARNVNSIDWVSGGQSGRRHALRLRLLPEAGGQAGARISVRGVGSAA